MEFRNMVMMTLYAKQKERHRCIEQNFGLCGRRRGWDVSREQHRNMYIIKGETDRQPRLDAWDKCSDLVHWEDPEGSSGEGGGRGDQDGEYMYIHGWFMSMYDKNDSVFNMSHIYLFLSSPIFTVLVKFISLIWNTASSISFLFSSSLHCSLLPIFC